MNLDCDTILAKTDIRNLVCNMVKAQDKKHLHGVAKELQTLSRNTSDANRNIRRLLNLMSKKRLGKKTIALVGITSYLWTFEATYVGNLNHVCVVLVENGHDLFDPIRRRFAESLKTISLVDTETKFKFLELHGFEIILRREDQNLRNRIAHYDYQLDKKGNITINGKRVDILRRILDLQTFLFSLAAALVKSLLEALS